MQKVQTFVDQLSAILVKNKIISEQEGRTYRDQFEQSDHDAFDYFLLSEGLVSKEDLLNALSILYQVPAVDVSGVFFDRDLLRNFPKDFLLKNEIIPLEWEEDFLIIVAANPADDSLPAKIGVFVSLDVEFQVGIATNIIDAIEEYYDDSLAEESNEDGNLNVDHQEEKNPFDYEEEDVEKLD